MNYKSDFLVIGSGLAGLSFALKAANWGKVIILSKTQMNDTTTQYAQGGIAAVTYKPDSYEKHVNDTINAGAGLCDENIVRMVVTEAPERIKELIDWGANFDKTPEGTYDLAKEGGHSEKRILHHKDNTGYEIQRALTNCVLSHPNIQVLEHHFSIDIITQHHLGKQIVAGMNDIECYGAYVLDLKTNCIKTFLSKITYIATGGIGNIYQTTTNPPIATGDGISMVYRAKGQIKNMEFIQFHPTGLYHLNTRPSFLITEAMRGAGAILRTLNGDEFMYKYDRRESLAPRDIVARAIDNEMKTNGWEYVYLDCTTIPKDKLINHFPNIYKKCLELGIDITKDYIPVAPAAHYVCGGINVNEVGATSIKNLYAGGETAHTGLHGANRLASNSLLEAVVFSHRSAIDAANKIKYINYQTGIPDWNDEGTSHPEEMILITQNFKELQQIMSNYVGIVRSNLRLKRALDRLEIIWRENEELYKKSTVSRKICELRNAITVGYLIIRAAQNRKENRGLHFTVDYPNKIF